MNSFFLQEPERNSPGFLDLESKKKGTQKGIHNLATMGAAHCASLDDWEQAQCGAYRGVSISACSFQARLASLDVL